MILRASGFCPSSGRLRNSDTLMVPDLSESILRNLAASRVTSPAVKLVSESSGREVETPILTYAQLRAPLWNYWKSQMTLAKDLD